MTKQNPRKILVIGGVAGGASAAARMRRLDEHADITMLERGPDVSFSNCALPYFLGGDIEESDTLRLLDPQTFWDHYRIKALPLHEALTINRKEKTVKVRNLKNNTETDMPYDLLYLSPGASPIMPKSIEGIDLAHVFSVRNVQDVEKIAAWLDAKQVKKAAVIGGGFIGVEVMENLVERGLKVSLIDMAPQVMMPFDSDMAQFLHKEIVDHGVELILGDGLHSIQEDGVTLKSGKKVAAEAVIMAIGVLPEVKLAKEAGLTIGETGGILVDRRMRTSDPSIYAVGDAVELTHFQTGQKTKLALAGPALRQARVAANSENDMAEMVPGVVGSSALRVFALNAACTGLSERACLAEGIQYQVAFVVPMDKVGIMPGASPVFFKLIYEPTSGRVLGAQAVGQGAVDKRIDVIATLLRFSGTILDLKNLELCYSPVFSTARDVVTMAALAACNISDGLVKQVMFTQLRDLRDQGALIIDVREADEFALGHIKGAKNIPLSQLRGRLDELPNDQPLYVHCRSGQRSYNAARALMQLGFDDVYNVAGSFVALCWHEYYQDKAQGREPIVTAYNFE